MPIIPQNSLLYSQLIEAIQTLETLLIPANDLQIAPHLAMLRLHFPIADLSEEAICKLMKDYLADLSGYPADIIELACVEYRRNGQNLYFPKVGQLLELIKKKGGTNVDLNCKS